MTVKTMSRRCGAPDVIRTKTPSADMYLSTRGPDSSLEELMVRARGF